MVQILPVNAGEMGLIPELGRSLAVGNGNPLQYFCFLYFSNWLHGDLRQYDISDPKRPRLVGQVGSQQDGEGGREEVDI